MMSQLELMQAATLIQNPRHMPRQVKPEDVRPSPFVGMAGGSPPSSARQVAGASDGVMRAERAKGETP